MWNNPVPNLKITILDMILEESDGKAVSNTLEKQDPSQTLVATAYALNNESRKQQLRVAIQNPNTTGRCKLTLE